MDCDGFSEQYCQLCCGAIVSVYLHIPACFKSKFQISIGISLTLCQAIGNGLVKHTKPYQNDHIISVIQELYFTEGPGGTASFATRFKHLFPTYKGLDGTVRYEVPVPMVALMATTVCFKYFLCMFVMCLLNL